MSQFRHCLTRESFAHGWFVNTAIIYKLWLRERDTKSSVLVLYRSLHLVNNQWAGFVELKRKLTPDQRLHPNHKEHINLLITCQASFGVILPFSRSFLHARDSSWVQLILVLCLYKVGMESKCSASFPPVKPHCENHQDTAPAWREKTAQQLHWDGTTEMQLLLCTGAHQRLNLACENHQTPNCALNLRRHCPWIHQEISSSKPDYPISSATTAACSKCSSKFRVIHVEAPEI